MKAGCEATPENYKTLYDHESRAIRREIPELGTTNLNDGGLVMIEIAGWVDLLLLYRSRELQNFISTEERLKRILENKCQMRILEISSIVGIDAWFPLSHWDISTFEEMTQQPVVITHLKFAPRRTYPNIVTFRRSLESRLDDMEGSKKIPMIETIGWNDFIFFINGDLRETTPLIAELCCSTPDVGIVFSHSILGRVLKRGRVVTEPRERWSGSTRANIRLKINYMMMGKFYDALEEIRHTFPDLSIQSVCGWHDFFLTLGIETKNLFEILRYIKREMGEMVVIDTHSILGCEDSVENIHRIVEGRQEKNFAALQR